MTKISLCLIEAEGIFTAENVSIKSFPYKDPSVICIAIHSFWVGSRDNFIMINEAKGEQG